MLKCMVIHVKDDTSANGVKSCSSAQHNMKMEVTVLKSPVLIDWRLQLKSGAEWRRMCNHPGLSVRKLLLHQSLVRFLSIPKEKHRETSSDWYRSMNDRALDLGLDMPGGMMCPPAGHCTVIKYSEGRHYLIGTSSWATVLLMWESVCQGQ